MDVVLLSRLQFAAATMFHFIFVPLTLGLSVLAAYMEPFSAHCAGLSDLGLQSV